jgi:hypothetical protein
MKLTRGLLAEYPDKDALVVAIHVLRSRGYTHLQAFLPFPVAEVDEALGRRRSPLALAAGFGATFGATGAYFLQWLLVAYLYPVDAGSRPPHMPLAYLIITIEMGFLFGGLAVFFACLFAAKLFRLWDPVCEVEGFESATRDGFWLGVGIDDPRWQRAEVEALIRGTAPRAIHGFGGLG